MLNKQYDLTCWYINVKRLAELFGAKSIPATNEFAGFLQKPLFWGDVKDLVLSKLSQTTVPTLQTLVIEGRAVPGAVFTHTGRVYCRGLNAFWDSTKKGEHSPALPILHGSFSLDSKLSRFECTYHPEHLTSQSASSYLSGNPELFVLGIIDEIQDETVKIKPNVIGSVVLNIFDRDNPITWGTHFEVTIDDIDSFSLVRTQPQPKADELAVMKEVSEREVKDTFALMLGEQTVGNDWGGEQSDLVSDKLILRGKRISTAFAFKGPAKFHEMKMRDLGKNGDQIHRLYTEPANLLVLQHCHEINSAVKGAMQAYAKNISNPRQFCIINGYDTLRLIRVYNPKVLEGKQPAGGPPTIWVAHSCATLHQRMGGVARLPAPPRHSQIPSQHEPPCHPTHRARSRAMNGPPEVIAS